MAMALTSSGTECEQLRIEYQEFREQAKDYASRAKRASTEAQGWREKRDAARAECQLRFLRYIEITGATQRQAAQFFNTSQMTISRTIDPQGHQKARLARAAQRSREPTNQNVGSNVVALPAAPKNRRATNMEQVKEIYPQWVHDWLQTYYSQDRKERDKAREAFLDVVMRGPRSW